MARIPLRERRRAKLEAHRNSRLPFVEEEVVEEKPVKKAATKKKGKKEVKDKKDA